MTCLQKRRLEVAAAADERAQRVRAAHQAKLARAEQLAAVVQQKKVEQTAHLKERSKLVAMRNEEVHHKRLLAPHTSSVFAAVHITSFAAAVPACTDHRGVLVGKANQLVGSEELHK